MVGLVHFLVLFMIVMTIGSISGAHVNPAVTLALLALRKIRPNDAAVYILLQLAGAVAGALMTKFLLIDDLADQQNVGATALNLSILGGDFQGFVAELLGAFFLVWAVVAVAVNPRAARDWSGLVIGGTLGFAVLIIGPLTGAALNPARWFGPALVSGEWNTPLLYIFAPDRRRRAGGAHLLVPVRRGPARSARRRPRPGPRACARTSTRRGRAAATSDCREGRPTGRPLCVGTSRAASGH